MTTNVNRRDVLGAAAAATAIGLTAPAFGAANGKPFRVGVIGSGWFGKLDTHALMQVAHAEVIAMCDVDSNMLKAAGATIFATPDSLHKPAKAPVLYHDYRKMLANHQFDIVVVATPDHWHTLAAIAAMKAGAHVYLEKPVSVDILEGQALVATARKHNRVVQVGTQRRTQPWLIEAREKIVRGGLLGKVGYVDVFGYYHQRPKTFPPATKPPANLDWNFYCGPAPLMPYHPGIHPIDWRAFIEFGNGYMGDLGVHMIDTSRWLLGLGWPNKVSSSGGVFVDKASISTVPDTQVADLQFDDLLMHWSNREWGNAPQRGDDWGLTLYGDKGKLKVLSSRYEFESEDGKKIIKGQIAPQLEAYPHDSALNASDRSLTALTRYNMRDFIKAIATGTRSAADIEQGYISTSCCILANTAYKLDRAIHWDGKKQHVIGDEAAQKALTRPYRAPWVHPEPV
jgi:predicted dehydrogenase